MSNELKRRDVLRGAAAFAGSTLAGSLASAQGSAEAGVVPFSAGTARPRIALPPNATDCHHHIYNTRYPNHPKATLTPPDATVADYRKLQQRIGTSRNVIVQPSTYGTDNRGLVEALRAFGPAARGVAVVDVGVSDDELQALHQAGVRGLRFNLQFLVAITIEMLEPLAKRVQRMGWHIQVNALGDQIIANRAVLERCPVPLVFDHMGLLPQPGALQHTAFEFIGDLMDRKRAWVKLSGVYNLSKVGAPDYSDYSEVASAFVKKQPTRLVWGSDWPHPTKGPDAKPDDARLVDLLGEWLPDAAARTRVLVDQPAEIYGY